MEILKRKMDQETVKRHALHLLELFIAFGQRVQHHILMLPKYKLSILWTIFVVGSFIHEFLNWPESYFSNKNNILNTLFVKRGWGWTLLLVGCTVNLDLHLKKSTLPVTFFIENMKLVILTLFWYMCTSFFETIEHATGECIGDEISIGKYACQRGGGFWSGFDISGHCFLLTFSALILNTEVDLHKAVDSLEDAEPADEMLTDVETLKTVHKFVSVCATYLMFIFELMLFFTCVYFHTLTQKLLGVLFGVGSWYICFTYVFAKGFDMLPL